MASDSESSLTQLVAMWDRMEALCLRLLSEMSALEAPVEEIDSLKAQHIRWITAREREHASGLPTWMIPSRDVIARVETDELNGLARYVSPTERPPAMQVIVDQLPSHVWRRR